MSNVVLSLVTFNGVPHLPHCLESIEQQTFLNTELVVLDNNSSDDSVSCVRTHAPQARIISETKNSGFAQGHNQIISQTSSDYVVILNQDAYLEEGYIAACISLLEKNKEAGSVTGVILQTTNLQTREKDGVIDTSGMVFRWNYFFEERMRGEPRSKVPEEREIFGVSAAVAVYRRSALEDCALTIDGKKEYFDNDFFMYKEDVDLALRMRLRGWQSFVTPDAVAYHVRSGKKETGRTNQFINLNSYRNTIALMVKNMSAPLLFRIFPAFFLFESAKFFYCLLFERSTLRALKEFWALRHVFMAKRRSILSARKVSDATMMSALHLS